ncbi:MAG: GntR family transcriptional regulator [Deltaproteobacteria bacterium]|nr:GntR family transcriptional regulator [Deltaproteobacteria bacterium]
MDQTLYPAFKEDGWSPYSLSLTDQVYFKIKDLIFTQQIVPGQKLQHEYLSEKLGVSTTPVREAINRLVQEGYVRSVARKGYYLNEITVDEADELYSFREIIEAYTVEKASSIKDEELIRDLKEITIKYHRAVQQPISMERLRADQEFHLRIAEACHNRFIKNALEKIFERLILKRSLEGFPQRGKKVYKEHEMILDCIMKQNVAGARKLIRQHIQEGRQNLILYLRRKAG